MSGPVVDVPRNEGMPDRTFNSLTEAKPRAAPSDHPCKACAVRGLSVCAALDAGELARLSAISSRKSFLPNAPVFHAGDSAQFVSNVVQGAVRLYNLLPDGRRQITGFLFPGDFLGMALNREYTYSAEAIDTVELCRFNRKQLEVLLDELPALERRLLGAASNELVAAQDQMLLLGRKSSREKIASFLLMLSRRAAERGEAADPVCLPMSRSDIADYLGLTTETVSRTITDLKRQGAIRLPANDRVALSDREKLAELADGF